MNKFAKTMSKAKWMAGYVEETWELNDCQVNDEIVKLMKELQEFLPQLTEAHRDSLYKQYEYLSEIEEQIRRYV